MDKSTNFFTGNKGEWSEIYVFLKLLADGKLYAADAYLNRIDQIYYPIIKILRKLNGNDFEYCRNGSIKIVQAENSSCLLDLPISEFTNKSIELFEKLKSSKGSSFSFPKIQKFLKSLNIESIKANSSEKRDITIVVYDQNIGTKARLGFSIKSCLGSASTLINASEATNIIYKIRNHHNGSYVSDINAIYNAKGHVSVRKRLEKIYNDGKFLEYYDVNRKTFKNNLQLIDSALPFILSQMVLVFYKSEASTVNDLANLIAKQNPCNFDLSSEHPFYHYKIKNLLTDAALGMKPSTVWNGDYDGMIRRSK